MSVANAAAVDAALIAVLAGDAALMALLPDGVYMSVGPPDMTRFVEVQLQTHEDVEAFRAPAYEVFRYTVKAIVLDPSTATSDAAAYRIHELLQDAPLVIAGYTHMSTLRVERVRYPDPDAVDSDLRWQHAGGDYEVYVSPD